MNSLMDSLFRYIVFLTISVNEIGAPILISSSDHNTSIKNQKQYEPLYIIKTASDRYKFVDSITYDLIMNKRKFDVPEQKMFAACSKTDMADESLEITNESEKEIAAGFRCNTPIQFKTSQTGLTYDHFSITFLISNRSKNDESTADNPPQKRLRKSDFPLTIISVAYRDDLDRSITTWHDIKYSNMISTDEESDSKDHRNQNEDVYNKDTNIYKFDIDKLYEMENQSIYVKKFLGPESTSKLVKLQLAPADDFFFDAWKHASRTNINTTPVWQELTAEWYQLEKFIRRVAKIVGDLRIITGGYSTLLYLGDQNSMKNLTVFQYIFKGVYFNQKCRNGDWIRQGIIFIMTNDPREEITGLDEYTTENGWRYSDDENLKAKIIAVPMNPEKLAELKVDTIHTYADFNLNQVKKLSKVGDNEETVTEINVVKMLQMKNTNDVEKVFHAMDIS